MDKEILKELWVRLLIGALPASEVVKTLQPNDDSGSDSPSLRQLLFADALDPTQTRMLLESAIGELGSPFDVSDCVASFVSDMAGKICSGEVAPYEGARLIWKASLLTPSGHDYDPFVYAASEYEDRPADRGFFEAAILDEARSIVLRGAVRR
ncbi:MAG: hypothetical protein ACSLE8_01165 [Rhodococcus sp. (in: high G+C Gram-positive bacteria)]